MDPTDDIDPVLENARRVERELLLKLRRIEDALNHVEADLPEEDLPRGRPRIEVRGWSRRRGRGTGQDSGPTVAPLMRTYSPAVVVHMSPLTGVVGATP